MRGFVKYHDFNDAAIDIEKLKSAVKLFILEEKCQDQFKAMETKFDELVEEKVTKLTFNRV